MTKLMPIAVGAFLLSAVVTFLSASKGLSGEMFAVRDIERIDASCRGQQGRTKYISCFRNKIAPRIRSFGMKRYVEGLVNGFVLPGNNSDIMSRCHDITHSIGQVGSRQVGASEAMRACTSLCGAGCFHGAVESYLSSGGNMSSVFTDLCKGTDEESMRSHWACLHGVGHGIGSIEADYRQALATCEIAGNTEDIKNCDRGVFMELFESGSYEHPLERLPEDLPAFCKTLTGEHAAVCFANMGLNEYLRSNNSKKAVVTCQKAPEAYRKDCLSLLGNKRYHEVNGDVPSIIEFCEGTGKVMWCLEGAIQEDVLSDPYARSAILLCAASPKEEKEACYTFLGERLKSIHGIRARETQCATLTEQFAAWCREGGQ